MQSQLRKGIGFYFLFVNIVQPEAFGGLTNTYKLLKNV